MTAAPMICPVAGCDTVTATWHWDFTLKLTPAASGLDDGYRCTGHARTLEQRERESRRAVEDACAVWRGPIRPARPHPVRCTRCYQLACTAECLAARALERKMAAVVPA